MLTDIRADIKKASDSEKAAFLQRFFKTKEGQYGHGDKFLGITVPEQRVIAKKYRELSLNDVGQLLKSSLHEERLIALIILTLQFPKATSEKQKEIYEFYLSNTEHINNWDLVDASADKIVGQYLYQLCHPELVSGSSSDGIPKQVRNDSMEVLKKLAKSELIWERRIAMIATFQFTKNGSSKETYEIASILIHDKHDLIQKAVGWMLREAGKKVSEKELIEFLSTRYKTMPRTALRYSIEKFPEQVRKKYLQGQI